jgi:hypothetical protein
MRQRIIGLRRLGVCEPVAARGPEDATAGRADARKARGPLSDALQAVHPGQQPGVLQRLNGLVDGAAGALGGLRDPLLRGEAESGLGVVEAPQKRLQLRRDDAVGPALLGPPHESARQVHEPCLGVLIRRLRAAEAEHFSRGLDKGLRRRLAGVSLSGELGGYRRPGCGLRLVVCKPSGAVVAPDALQVFVVLVSGCSASCGRSSPSSQRRSGRLISRYCRLNGLTWRPRNCGEW